jgi:hypothetical protein
MQGGSANNAPSFFQVASFGSPLKAGFTRLFAVKLIYKQQLWGTAGLQCFRRPSTRAAQRFALQTEDHCEKRRYLIRFDR